MGSTGRPFILLTTTHSQLGACMRSCTNWRRLCLERRHNATRTRQLKQRGIRSRSSRGDGDKRAEEAAFLDKTAAFLVFCEVSSAILFLEMFNTRQRHRFAVP